MQSELGTVRDQAKQEAEAALTLRVREKEEQIASMQRQIEDLRRKAEQGSQQLQGEVQELALEALLRQKFPRDVLEPVPKGEFGGEPRCAVAVAIALRESLIALSAARLAGEGQLTKMEVMYQYLTGPRFRHRIEAVVERFSDMQADLDRERKTMMRLWAKREEQIRGVVESTAGLYGDLQGIAGRSLLEIDGLEIPLLDGPPAHDAAE